MTKKWPKYINYDFIEKHGGVYRTKYAVYRNIDWDKDKPKYIKDNETFGYEEKYNVQSKNTSKEI